jgi:hypothetical protein
MRMKKQRMSKLFSQILAVVLVVALVAGGTYALVDFTQHKTNVFSGENKNLNVTLNEDFKPHDNWKEGVTVPKTVSVTNVLDTVLPEVAYVRLALKEYMDMTEVEYTYATDGTNPYRFLTYTAVTAPTPDAIGEFITFATRKEGTDWAKAYPDFGFVPADITGPFTNALAADPTAKGFYVKTDVGDVNGQYGKYLVTEIKGDKTKVIAAKDLFVKWDHELTDFHAENGDKYEYGDFARYIWKEKTAAVREFVKVNFGADVIPMSGWDGNPVQKWIYDDYAEMESTAPYVYWGAPLAPGQTTTNFLESVTLLKQPKDRFFYAIRVDMETVTKDDIDKLVDLPGNIKVAWTKVPKAAKILANDGYDFDYLFADNRLGNWKFELEAPLDISAKSGNYIEISLEHKVNGTGDWILESAGVNSKTWDGIFTSGPASAHLRYPHHGKSYPNGGGDIIPAGVEIGREESAANTRYPKAYTAINDTSGSDFVDLRAVYKIYIAGVLEDTWVFPAARYTNGGTSVASAP